MLFKYILVSLAQMILDSTTLGTFLTLGIVQLKNQMFNI